MTDSKHDDDLLERAHALGCPFCGARPHENCRGPHQWPARSMHNARLDAARTRS